MPRILIVDDDDVDRELASRCLRSVKDVEIRQAADGQAAWDALADERPDLVLTDLRMPRVDGLELVQKVREQYPAIPVVLMTGQGSERIAVSALKAGAASYVPKGDLKQELADTVRQVLAVVAARSSEEQLLRYLDRHETSFVLDNDPGLIAPLAAFLQRNLERLVFADDSVRTQVAIALSEAISNAMIRGNLEVGSELRQDDLEGYHALIHQRRGEAPYRARRVRCIAHESRERVEYAIADEGPGFDPNALPDPASPESLARVHGRGILLMRTFMDRVDYNAKGNQVTMTKKNVVE